MQLTFLNQPSIHIIFHIIDFLKLLNIHLSVQYRRQNPFGLLIANRFQIIEGLIIILTRSTIISSRLNSFIFFCIKMLSLFRQSLYNQNFVINRLRLLTIFSYMLMQQLIIIHISLTIPPKRFQRRVKMYIPLS